MDAIIFPLISAKRHANNVDFQEERYMTYDIFQKDLFATLLSTQVSEILESRESGS